VLPAAIAAINGEILDNLHKLKAALIKYEAEIHAALKQDLGKPEFEAYLSETGFCLHDISTTLNKLKGWMKPKLRLTIQRFL
jgi:aldehyde dehydrogenase (NAD+)